MKEKKRKKWKKKRENLEKFFASAVAAAVVCRWKMLLRCIWGKICENVLKPFLAPRPTFSHSHHHHVHFPATCIDLILRYAHTHAREWKINFSKLLQQKKISQIERFLKVFDFLYSCSIKLDINYGWWGSKVSVDDEIKIFHMISNKF